MNKLSKKEWIAVAAGIVIIAVYFFNRSTIFNFFKAPLESAQNKEIMITTEPIEGLTIQEIKVGTGEQATNGKTLLVHYRGTFTNGTEFDNSYNGKPLEFQLGVTSLIEGFEKGVVGMKVGGKRRLTIAPELAYGVNGVPGVIPPSSTLIFEIELLDVK